MRPPEEFKDYWKPMEEYSLQQLDEPRGWNTVPRWKRALWASLTWILMVAGMVALPLLTGEKLTDPVYVGITLLFLIPLSAFLILVVIDPRRAIRLQFWGSPPPDSKEDVKGPA